MNDFAWEHLRDVHDSLKEQSTRCQTIKREAFFRSCMNRCYYMAFNICKRTALQKFQAPFHAHRNIFITNKSGGSHELVIHFFRDRPETECKDVAKLLELMKKSRKTSDYDESSKNFNPETEMELQEQYLENILENLKKL